MTIKITKQLATVEDLAIGTGTVVQERNGVPLTLTKIDFVPKSEVVIRVTSIAAMEAYSAPVGYVFSLNAGGRSGTFDVIAGDFSAELAADTLNGIYIGLADDTTATTKVAKRRASETLSVLWFGAVGDGIADDTAALQLAFDLLAGREYGELDLQGNTYLISNRILVLAMWQKLIHNGAIKASESFPTAQYLLELDPSPLSVDHIAQPDSVGHKHEDIKLDSLTLDASYRGGCISLVMYLRFTISKCYIRRYTTYGLTTADEFNQDAHELTVVDSFFRTNNVNIGGVGTALYITKNDGTFNNIVIVGGITGIHITASYNFFDGIHLYSNSLYGLFSEGSSFCSYTNMYFDGVFNRFELPWNVVLTNSRFLFSESQGNDSRAAIEFVAPSSGSHYYSGCKIVSNSFHLIRGGESATTEAFKITGNWSGNFSSYSGNVFSGNSSVGIVNTLVRNSYDNIHTSNLYLGSLIPGTYSSSTVALTTSLSFNLSDITGQANHDSGINNCAVIESDNRSNYLGNYPVALRFKFSAAPGSGVSTPTDKILFYRNGDVEMNKLITTSPDGSRWKLSVANDGTIVTDQL